MSTQPPIWAKMLIDQMASIDRKIESFMAQNQAAHEKALEDMVAVKTKMDVAEGQIVQIKEELGTAFHKIRVLERKILYFTGAGAVLVFIATKAIDKYWK